MREAAAGALSYALLLAFLFIGSVAGAAQCFGFSSSSGSSPLEAQVREVDGERDTDMFITGALASAWTAAGRDLRDLDLLILESDGINAASFGDGQFIFWEGTAGLTPDQLAAIAAHEVAHDVLLHSRRRRDVRNLLRVIAEAASIVTGVDRSGEHVLREWIESATIPRYSQVQELEADAAAVELLGTMGYNEPEAVFVDALKVLQERYGDTGGSRLDYHPATSDRIDKVGASGPDG